MNAKFTLAALAAISAALFYFGVFDKTATAAPKSAPDFIVAIGSATLKHNYATEEEFGPVCAIWQLRRPFADRRTNEKKHICPSLPLLSGSEFLLVACLNCRRTPNADFRENIN
jgi:hypothetical protein